MCVCVCGFFTVSYALHLLILERIVNIMKVYIKTSRNNIQVEFIRFRKKLATLLTFETLKWKYTFATDLLITIRDESPLVCRAPDVSEHRQTTKLISLRTSVTAFSSLCFVVTETQYYYSMYQLQCDIFRSE